MIRSAHCALLALLALCAAAPPLSAEPRRGAATPRELVQRFYEQSTADDLAAAVRLCEPSPRPAALTAQLVRRLRTLLDQRGAIDLDEVSGSPEGDLDDALPADRERVAAPGVEGDGPGSLLLVRVDTEDGKRWLISRGTLAHVEGWYHALPSRWLIERLPPIFMQLGPFGLRLWQWLALPGVLLVALLGAYGCGRLSTAVVRRYARRGTAAWDEHAIGQLRRPFVSAWFLALIRLLLPTVALPSHAFGIVKQGLRGALVAVVFWAAIALVEAVRLTVARDSAAHPSGRAMIGLGGRLLKMVLVVIAIVVIIAEMGFSVTSIVAGIGVGGLGLALAAQKTVENVFGAFSLGVDQPFREGDVVLVDGTTGTIETIGLRSTRIRTLDRTLVAIPNGKLAEMKTETLSARDRFRLHARLALRPDTKPAVLRAVVLAAEKLMREHEKADTDARARVVLVTPAAIEVEVIVSFLTTNADEFGRIRQEILLGLLDILEQEGTAIAPSSQAVQLVNPPAR